jgi:hypothetical protein
LEVEITQSNLKQKEEVDSIRAKFTAQIKNLEIAREDAIRVSGVIWLNIIINNLCILKELIALNSISF